jgi:hypothetical protein
MNATDFKDLADEQGWSGSTQVAVLLEYIESQKNPEAFGDFLREHIAYDEGYGENIET